MTERICLKCDKKFESLSKGNRICPKCKALKHVPAESGFVNANRRLKEVLKKKNIKPEVWNGFKEFEDHDDEA